MRCPNCHQDLVRTLTHLPLRDESENDWRYFCPVGESLWWPNRSTGCDYYWRKGLPNPPLEQQQIIEFPLDRQLRFILLGWFLLSIVLFLSIK